MVSFWVLALLRVDLWNQASISPTNRSKSSRSSSKFPWFLLRFSSLSQALIPNSSYSPGSGALPEVMVHAHAALDRTRHIPFSLAQVESR